MKVLVIAPHPDDETLGMGGTIARYNDEGAEVKVCFVTDGVTARHTNIEKQKECAINACKLLGVKEAIFLNFPDQRLDQIPLIEIIQPLEECIKRFNPHIVFCPPLEDVNKDHQIVFEATMVAVRPIPGRSVVWVVSYEVPSSTEWAPKSFGVFEGNLFVDISNYIGIKLKALEEYAKAYCPEIKPYPHPRSFRGVELLAQERGMMVGLKYAERFNLIRAVGELPWVKEKR